MALKVIWTAETIAAKSPAEVKNLRENALRLGNQVIVDICDTHLASLKPPKPMRIKKVKSSTGDGIVRGFHFICPTEKDVHLNPDGTFWTGTWVVAEGHAEMAPKVGAYVALHTEHASNSYRYGVVKDWRLEKRKEAYVDGQKVKTDKGIDFLIEPTDESVPWRGHGIVEKSYYYGE